MKTRYFIILIISLLVCSLSKAQTTTTFTINSGLTNTVLAAPMAAGDSVILIKGSYPAWLLAHILLQAGMENFMFGPHMFQPLYQ